MTATVKTNNNKEIAMTILNQLGGFNRLNAMVGLKDVTAIENGVSFKIKYRGAAANYVKIQLNGLDLYDVEIGNIRGSSYKVVTRESNYYADMLKSLVQRTCKVYLSL